MRTKSTFKAFPDHSNAKVMPRIWAGLIVCTIRGLRRFVSHTAVACSDRIRMCVMLRELSEYVNCGARWRGRNGCILSLGDYL